MKDVLDQNLQSFIRELLPVKNELFCEIESYAKEKHVSIVDYEVAVFLKMMVALKRPKKILEIGTGLAFSTIHMAEALDNTSQILTIERLQERLEKASYFIKKSQQEKKITLIHEDARDFIIQLNETFDFIFLDAAKGQYGKFLESFDHLLEPGGLIIADNVLVNGWVIDLEIPERRKRTMVNNMRKFLESFLDNEKYEMSLVPLGDGLALIRKR